MFPDVSTHARQARGVAPLLLTTLICLLLAACNTAKGQSPTGTSTSSTSLSALAGAHGTTVGPLHIEATDGLTCSQYLVLNSAPSTYDVSALKRMDTYLASIAATPSSPPTPSPGVSLQWAGRTGTSGGCPLSLEITNVGSTTLQIPQIDLRVTAPPQHNGTAYHEVAMCSFPAVREVFTPIPCPPGRGSTPGPCSGYSGIVALSAQDAIGSVVATKLSPEFGDGCPTLTLQPGDTASVILLILSTGAEADLAYSVVPEVIVQDQDTQHVLTLSQFMTLLPFANPDQFTCYALQGQTLQPVDVDDSTQWCY